MLENSCGRQKNLKTPGEVNWNVKSGEPGLTIGLSNSEPALGSAEPLPEVTVWLPFTACQKIDWPVKIFAVSIWVPAFPSVSYVNPLAMNVSAGALSGVEPPTVGCVL